MNKTTIMLLAAAAVLAWGCSKNNTDDNGGSGSQGEGYADPSGVLVLNQGARMSENSSLTYISPEGEVEEDIYRKANGTAFGNEAQNLYIHNGKVYLLSNCIFNPGGEEGDGVLVIADAATMKAEKKVKMGDLKFKRPEGSLEESEWLPLTTPFECIAVIDEKNVFFGDEQGIFRYDSTTGETFLIEGSYHFGNQGSTIEGVASTRGMLRVGDCLYCGGGGFWETTRFMELSKDKNEVTRVIPDLNGDFISGLCRTGEREVMLATCGRKGEKKSYLYFIDLDKWEIVKEKRISEDISAEFFNTSGIVMDGDYIYYAAGTTTVRRLSLSTWTAEDYIDVTKDAPQGVYLNCNVMTDPVRHYLYVAVSDEYSESDIPANNYLLVYDCSGDTPVLVQNIHNKTHYPIGIFPVSNF